MSYRLDHGASGAIRRFAGWVARGSVGHPILEGINYWDDLKDSPSQMETCFAIFANVLELDDEGTPSTRNTPSAAPPHGSTGTALENSLPEKRTLSRGSARSTD